MRNVAYLTVSGKSDVRTSHRPDSARQPSRLHEHSQSPSCHYVGCMMMWVRFDCAAPYHRKVLSAGAEAAWLWAAGLCYSNQRARDGWRHPRVCTRELCTLDSRWTPTHVRKLAARLSEVGLWHPRPDGGWDIHDYAEYQHPALRAEQEKKKVYQREKKRSQRAKAESDDPSSTVEGQGVRVGLSRPSPRYASRCPRDVPWGRPRDVPWGRPRDVPWGRPRDVPWGRPRDVPRGRPTRSLLPVRSVPHRSVSSLHP